MAGAPYTVETYIQREYVNEFPGGHRITNYAAFFWMKERVGKLIEFGRCQPLFEAPAHPLTAAYVSGMSG